ncbi:hypothetical protein [Paenimyroides aestuarii]|uniref:Uncharacterized protein n=1 Tax=Paenimyroides aestuarii TaxID=2968490 RepID=A0ABY5NV54_9FLAO|nr:hypothetical protein [Paenimyroides aestuarii]UUV22451.1 hypothetical protein NPX36_05270 [Paenimyroides aestuarii]
MKKMIFGTVMFFAIQVGFAQSQDAQTFVSNMGVKAQIEGAKQQILPAIDTAKVDEFTKEFDAVASNFITDFTKLVDENYDATEIKDANKKYAETKEMTQIAPKDAAAFEQKINALQAEVGMTMQGLVMKYASEEAMQQAEE